MEGQAGRDSSWGKRAGSRTIALVRPLSARYSHLEQATPKPANGQSRSQRGAPRREGRRTRGARARLDAFLPATMSSPSSAGSPHAQNQANNPEDQPPPPASETDLDNSFFPSPPAFYKRYTTTALSLPPSAPLPPLEGIPACTAAELEPPNPEWILEGGAYQVFGETWPVEEVLPTLEEMGVTEMFVRGAGTSFTRVEGGGEANAPQIARPRSKRSSEPSSSPTPPSSPPSSPHRRR